MRCFKLLYKILIFLGIKKRTIFVGKDAKVFINGEEVRFIAVDCNFTYNPIETLGKYEAEEL